MYHSRVRQIAVAILSVANNRLLLSLLILSLCGNQVLAAGSSYAVSLFDYPGSGATDPLGINSQGDVVGETGFSGATHLDQYMYINGAFGLWPYDSSWKGFHLMGISDSGQMAADCADFTRIGRFACLINGSSITQLNYPGSSDTLTYSMDDSGRMLGSAAVGGICHGFIYENGSFSTVDYPGSSCSGLTGANNVGQFVGFEWDASGRQWYIYDSVSGLYTFFPGNDVYWAADINDSGQVVGGTISGHAFLYENGSYRYIEPSPPLDAPDGKVNAATGINNNGEIIGWYTVADYSHHGFKATPTSSLDLDIDKNLGEGCNGLGDPINIAIGNETQKKIDYVGKAAFSLEMARYYNSSTVYAGKLGTNWIFNYERTLSSEINQSVETITTQRPDGKKYKFKQVNGAWATDADTPDTLEELKDAGGARVGWRYTDLNDVAEQYDVAGKLVSITNRAGQSQTLAYDAANRLQNVTDDFGRVLTFNYDAQGRLSSVTDPAGGIYTYAYDTDNNLSTVTYPDGKFLAYLYNEVAYTSGANLPHALTGIIDENGSRFATITYDSLGRGIATEHAGGAERIDVAYNSDGSATVIDALNTVRTYDFQAILGVAKRTGVTQPCAVCGGTAAQNVTYDANGNIVTKTDFNGVVTTYVYDLTRNLETSRTEAYGTPDERTITTQWHPTFRLPTLITEPGTTTAYTYDDTAGLLLQKTITDTVLNTSRTWHYTYTTAADGTVPSLLKTVDGPRADVADITTYGHDVQGNVTSIINALSQVTQITGYDANGRPLTIVDPNGVTTTLTYAPRGWLTSRAVSDGATTEATTYDYDGVGQLTQVTLPDNSYISYTYDAAHRLTGIADSLGNHVSYTLDAMGNRTAENIYDPSNTLTQTRSHVYNALNRLAQDIGAQNQTTNYSYDNNGNLTASTDPLGHTTTNGYDALNRLVQVTDHNSGVTHYGYDAQDHLTSVTDPRNLQTTYTYDALGDLGQQVSPDTGTTTNTYDDAGNLLTATDARGAVTNYAYDALNRVTQISATLGGTTATTTYQYDTGPHAVGKLTAVSDAGSTTTYAYDSFGRLTTKTQQIGTVSLTVAYAYDSAGRLSQVTYPSGKVVSYGYDRQGRIDVLGVDGQPMLNNIQYSPVGVATGWSWGNGSLYSRPLDSDGRVASFTLNGNPRTVTYDAASRITDLADALRQSYGYDNLDRLVSYTSSTVNQTFDYDAVGNRTQFSDAVNSDTYTYGTTSNRLTAIAGSHARTYSYAANGNITGDGSHSYSYDPRNRLVDVDNDTTYTINGLGQRIEKVSGSAQAFGASDANGDGAYTAADSAAIIDQILALATAPGNADCNQDGNVNVQDLVCLNNLIAGNVVPVGGGEVLFAYDEQGQLIGEYNSNGDAIEETVYLGNQPVAVLKQSNVYYIHTDQLNTPRVISDSTDKVVWRWDSDPFGTTAANEDPDMDGVKFTYNLRFPGQYYDGETGLHYNYYRDYDPGTGRYIESDPIGLVGGLNTYVYVGGDPLHYTDPKGQEALLALGGGIVGAVWGGVNGWLSGDRGATFWVDVAAGAGTGALAGLTNGVSLLETAEGFGIRALAGSGISHTGNLPIVLLTPASPTNLAILRLPVY